MESGTGRDRGLWVQTQVGGLGWNDRRFLLVRRRLGLKLKLEPVTLMDVGG